MIEIQSSETRQVQEETVKPLEQMQAEMLLAVLSFISSSLGYLCPR